MTFFEYMMRFLKKDSQSGDLARDMMNDKEQFLGGDSSRGKIIIDFLISKGACSECIDTFIDCYARYVKYELKQYRKQVV